MSNKPTIAITGATGFIGRCVVSKALEMGFDVRAISRTLPENNKIDHFTCDLTDLDSMDGVFDGCKYIVHLAAKVPYIGEKESYSNSYKNNVLATENVLKCAASSKSEMLVFTSSWRVYGNNPKNVPICESNVLDPDAPYSRTKIEAENFLTKKEFEKPKIVILRLSNVYGENEKEGGIISNFIRNVSNGVPIEIIGNGESARDYIYVEDVAEAILAPLLNLDIKYNIFNIGSGYPTTVLEIYNHVKYAYKKFNIHIPKPNFVPTKEHNIKKFLDTSRSSKYLKFKPRTNISNGIEKIVLWTEMNRNKK